MSLGFAALSAALLMHVADAPAPAPANPISAFFNAADMNDFAAMKALMAAKDAGFLKLISNCYLRRVYADNQTHQLIAAWMCDEGQNRSRVLLADVAQTPDGKVAVSVRMNTTNDRPAPPRTGSAFAN
jgi:hypothetical protein